jgi:hypothetical protein
LVIPDDIPGLETLKQQAQLAREAEQAELLAKTKNKPKSKPKPKRKKRKKLKNKEYDRITIEAIERLRL